MPRILEQSLLNAFNSELNGENSTVLFSFNKFDLSIFCLRQDKKVGSVNKEVEFRDVNSGELLITATSLNEAAIVLGKSRERVRLYLNNVKSIYSPNLKKFVRINSVGNTELVDSPIDIQNPSIYPEISLIDINNLELNIIYIFLPDKKTIYGKFKGYSARAKIHRCVH